MIVPKITMSKMPDTIIVYTGGSGESSRPVAAVVFVSYIPVGCSVEDCNVDEEAKDDDARNDDEADIVELVVADRREF